MSDILIEVESGKSKRLKTANKVCKEDIVVTGVGGGGGDSQSSDLFPYVRYVDFTADLQEVKDDITLHLERAPSLNGLFATTPTINAPKVTIYINEQCTSFQQTFMGNGRQEGLKTVEIIGNTSTVKSFNRAFYWRITLENINCEFDFSSATDVGSTFAYSSALKEVRFKANTLSLSISFAQSPNLSAESIQSIIDVLADLTGGETQTLTFHATVGAKLTDEQKATLTAKNWTLVY